jgi:hypothetical protein
MTKKHFIEIAAALKSERNNYIANAGDTGWNPVDNTAKRLANTFATINPNFDRRRFLEACGIGEE